MKIVIIHGQKHKGSTYHVAHLLLDNIREPKEIREFFLPRDLEHFCLGCYSCIEDETACPFYQEKWEIMQAVEETDLLILTTPTYCMAPSAGMKTFMDLTFTYWVSHRPRACMFSKRAVVLSTTAGVGTSSAIKPIKQMLTYWGISSITTYGIGVQAMNWQGVRAEKKEKIEKDMARLGARLSDKSKPRVSLKVKFLFCMMAMMQKGHMGSGETERLYWEEKGWLDKKRPWNA